MIFTRLKMTAAALAVLIMCFAFCACGEDKTYQVYMYIDCRTVFNNAQNISPAVLERLPENGVIFDAPVFVKKNQTAAQVLASVCKANSIQADIYSGYVRGICNLYEKDCGAESGWMVAVNGEFLALGASSYYVKENDTVAWFYSCKRGDDVDPKWEAAP